MTENKDAKFAEVIRDRLVQQLTSANEQLEQFAYVASHDLREPLRTIVCFTDLLEKEFGKNIPEEGRKYMELTKQAARKMESMIADLLEYARLGQCAERLSEIDCNTIIQETEEALSESIISSHAQITSDVLPTVFANPLRLSSLFQNLIGNAIKYQYANAIPQVHISFEESKDHWTFCIKDNGIGISPEHLESIFEPFKRLHNERDYAGTGIGLAICKRIVESIGGKIWATSTLGEGSAFYFTLPKRNSVPI